MRVTPKVLVVDDEERLRHTLVQMVQALDFAARGAGSAEEAMRLLASECVPGIVILDLHLPGKGGLELFEWIVRDRPGTPVIILTGFGDLDSAQQAILLGIVDYLTKPCTMGNLEQALSRAAGHLQLGDAAPPDTAPATHATSLEAVEHRHILASLRRHHGNRRATAAELGISLRTLYYRLARYGEE